MGKWLKRLEALERSELDDDMRSATTWIALWRSQGRHVWINGNDVMVENWHTLSDSAKESLRYLQPHLMAALTLETASA